MQKTLLFIFLCLLFACNNPDQSGMPEGDSTVVVTGDTPEATPRSAARAVLPSGQVYDTLANGDTLFYIKKDTTVAVPYTYKIERVELHPKKPLPPDQNVPPIARAGADQVLTLPNNTTTLDGSASTDANNNIKSYGWRKVSGGAATLTDTNKAIATVTGLVKGVYVFELRVADVLNAFTADMMTVTVNDGTTPPTGTPIAFTFSQLPVGSPDLNRPRAGAEQWHDRNDVNLGYTPQDVYYRFVATRIATSQRNVYSWNYFDGLVNAAISRRQKFSFGIMTVYPEGTTNEGLVAYDGGTSCYPIWLHQLMQGEGTKDWRSGSTWIPNYNSNNYLSWVLELNQAINSHINATSFNGVSYKDVISSIDIRSYGSWGEWHSASTVADGRTVMNTYPGYGTANSTFPSATSLKRIVDGYTQGFPDIQLSAMIAGYDAHWLNNTYNPPEIAYYLLTQRNSKGFIGWRRDQWGALDQYLHDYLENNNRSFNGLTFKDSIMPRYKTAPITGEPPAWIPDNYSQLEPQIRLYHATSFGNGNYGTNTPSTTIQDRVKAASKAAGYRLVSSGGSFTPGSTSISITTNWQNIGLCPMYDNWNIVYEVVNSSGGVITLGVSNFKPRLFLPASSQSSSTDVFPLNLPAGSYTLRFAVRDPSAFRVPAYLNIQGRNSDGSYNIKTFQR